MALGHYAQQKFTHAKHRYNAFDALPVLSPRFARADNFQDSGNDDKQPHNVIIDPLETSQVPAVTNDVTSSIHSSTFSSGPPATTSSLPKSVASQAATSSTASARFASSSASPTTSSSSSGAIAGGVVVGLIGFAVLVCVVVCFVRRSWRRREDQFDANEFRRSAVLMPDLPTHQGVINRGFHRSPFMAEHKPPPLLVQVYPGSVPSSSVSSHSERGNNATNPIASPVPPSPSSYATAGHGQPDQSSTPRSFVTRQQFDPPSSRRASRPASGNDPGAANGFIFPRRQPPPLNILSSETAESKPVTEQVSPNDYVDLSRSSVQAMQPREITKRLEVSRGCHDNEVATPSPTRTVDDSASPPRSLFENGHIGHKSLANSIRESISSSSQSMTQIRTPELQDFPVPPSPAPTVTSRYQISMPPVFPESMAHSRIDSLPPVLPELDLGNHNSHLYERLLSNSFVKRKSLYKSSPLASSGIVAEAAQVPAIAEPATPKRPETVYNPTDAYGGI